MRAAAVVCLALAASAAMSVARADDPLVTVFTDGPQTVTIIRGCTWAPCLNRVANAEENGRLQLRKVRGRAKAYFVRTASATETSYARSS